MQLKPKSSTEPSIHFESTPLSPDHHAENHDNDEMQAHGGAELGWLVSYADMMTLLFGLFAILYTTAQDKTKSVDAVMREVSARYFSSPRSGGLQVASTPVPNSPLSHPTGGALDSSDQDTINSQSINSQSSSELADKLSAEKSALEQKISELESKVAMFAKKLPLETHKNRLLQKELEHVKDQLKEEQTEKDQLKADLQNKKPEKTFMMAILSWETERHDLDLEIRSPSGKTFNFKLRQFNGQPGRFEFESRFGPGAEIWRADNFEPGEYLAKLSMYNSNGNSAAAKASFAVVTNFHTQREDPITLGGNILEKQVRFGVDSEGRVKFSR